MISSNKTPTLEPNKNEEINFILDSIRRNVSSKESNETTTININQLNLENTDWTPEIEEEILKMAKCCKSEASELHKKGVKMVKMGKLFNVGSIVFSALTIYVSSSSLTPPIKDPIVIVFSACSAITNSIYSLYRFSKNGSIYKEVSHGLDNLSTNLRCEVYKPIKSRKNVNDLIFDAQLEREKLLSKADKASE
jgi:hypothetical protein